MQIPKIPPGMTAEGLVHEARQLRAAGRLLEAHAVFTIAAVNAPTVLTAWSGLGLVCHDLSLFPQAAEAFGRAVELAPDDAILWRNLGSVLLLGGGTSSGAIAALERAVALDPAMVAAWDDLGMARLSVWGKVGGSVEAYDRALALAPERIDIESRRLLALAFDEGVADETLFDAHRKFGRRYDGLADRTPFPNLPDPERRLRVGYVSSNVHAHIGSAVLRPLFVLHDRAQVEVIVYAASPVEDHVSAELKPLADLWVPCAALDEASLAARIRADRIDVLIHSMGSWPDHRLGVLAHRAAPVQVECISQSPAICMAEVDANIVDPWLAAGGLLGRLSGDRIVELPSGYFTTSMLPDRPILPAPRHRGGPSVVLGSFNRLAKISPGTVRRWARVMAQLPDAPLIVKGPEKLDESEVVRMRAAWRDLGIDVSRVEFRGHAEGDGYWDNFADVDLLLDSLPFNGGRTTTCGAWMGVPTISERARPPYGRLGDCILSRLGCADLVADDADGYVAKAVSLARDPARLDAYRANLRGRFAQSTLLESPHYVRELEAALRMLWREWCAKAGR